MSNESIFPGDTTADDWDDGEYIFWALLDQHTGEQTGIARSALKRTPTGRVKTDGASRDLSQRQPNATEPRTHHDALTDPGKTHYRDCHLAHPVHDQAHRHRSRWRRGITDIVRRSLGRVS